MKNVIEVLSKNIVDTVIKDDPVRPHLTADFRTTNNGEVYGLYDETYTDLKAVICVAYTNEVPEDENQLIFYSQAANQDGQHGKIAIFYTVWSYAPGSGRKIVIQTADHIHKTKPVKRFVTLSPLTEMARKFHISNGAKFIAKHSTCQNFEYELDN